MGRISELPYGPSYSCEFGPPNAFWCFAYERLNGVLAGFPNSKRNVEVEVYQTGIGEIFLLVMPIYLALVTWTSQKG